ncbi:MAG: DUF4007 family protein [Acidobacteria bacterium]|nr:DUF4007 family protein [Acidobacteriota bacterium]
MTVAERMSFSGHETFPFRYTWLKKAVDAAARDGCAFHADDAAVRLGVGKNMVASIRHWGVVTGMLEEGPGRCGGRVRQLRATDLGRSLLGDEGWDPFLEDPGTLWLLHWQIASRPAGATTWWWVFNQCPATVFTRGELLDALQAVVSQRGATRVTGATLKRDLDVFLRTYAPQGRRSTVLEDTLDCPLAELGVLRASSRDQTYALVRANHDTLPDGIFAWALAEHLVRQPARAQTVTLEHLAFGAGAPGRVFCLDEPGLLGRLDRIEALTEGGVVFDETAGLKQVYVHEAPDPARLLHRYYEPRSTEDQVRWPSRQQVS